VTMTFCAMVSFGSCSSLPPEGSLERIKLDARQEHYKQCVNMLMREFYEEIQAGLYQAGDLAQACRRWAKERVR